MNNNLIHSNLDAARSTHRPSFSSAGLPPKVAASTVYRRAYQKSRFNLLMNSSTKASEYIDSSSYLSTGHLSPHADFLCINTQRATYFYINACPQW